MRETTLRGSDSGKVSFTDFFRADWQPILTCTGRVQVITAAAAMGSQLVLIRSPDGRKTAKPSQAKPSQAKPSQAKPSQSQAKPSQATVHVLFHAYAVLACLMHSVNQDLKDKQPTPSDIPLPIMVGGSVQRLNKS